MACFLLSQEKTRKKLSGLARIPKTNSIVCSASCREAQVFLIAYPLKGSGRTNQLSEFPSCACQFHPGSTQQEHRVLTPHLPSWFLSGPASCSCHFSFLASKKVLNMSSILKNIHLKALSYYQVNHVSVWKFYICIYN